MATTKCFLLIVITIHSSGKLSGGLQYVKAADAMY